jgi:2-dehydropantoate 2-reductase
MKICIYGAGAIGGHLAARFARGGADVSVVARGAQLAAIRERGIAIEDHEDSFTASVRASDDPGAFGPQDAVVVAVKAPALPAVAAGIAPLLGPQTPVLFAMNGIPWWYFYGEGGPRDGELLDKLDPGGALWNAIGPDRALGGVVYCACAVTSPGTVRVISRHNRIIMGEPAGGTARAELVAAALSAGGLAGEVTPRIREAIWAKLLLNLATGPLCVLARADQATAFSEPTIADAARRILEEGAAIARALGNAVDLDVDRVIASASRLLHKPSIVQDLELGRPMEIAALYDATLDLARGAGVPTPMLDLLVALTRVRARADGLYAG